MATVLYAFAVDSLMYAMMCTRSNIAHVARVVSRYMSNPCKHLPEVVKWILKYLSGTSNSTLGFRKPGLGL